jgi:D-beta-D-heptose 7-phosphate kinase/D-beta-D-heptose 1-phosphate adenosyltransferase
MGRLVSLEDAIRERERLRSQGKVIVFTNGCFDLLHRGHVDYLQRAREMGDALFVGLNSDSSVRALKGEGRPIVSQDDRAAVLASLAAVDLVIIFAESTPALLIDALRPDILVKGGDYRIDQVVGRETVEASNGKVVIIDLIEGYSTRELIKRIVQRYRRGQFSGG